MRLRRLSSGIALAIGVLLGADPAGATSLTLSQEQLLTLEDVTSFFGGNGEILSRTASGDGVLFEIAGGTIDYGKVAGRWRIGGADLTPYDAFGLHMEIVQAPAALLINPFVQTGPSGYQFFEDVSGDRVQGDAWDGVVSLSGLPYLDVGYALGFQYFTAGGVEMTPAQTVQVRIDPLAGADVIGLPEPGTLLACSLGLAGAALAGRKS